MRVFKHKYVDKFGENRETKNYYVEFNDHREIVRRIPANSTKEATENTGRQLENLVALRETNSPIRADIKKWLISLPEKRLNKLVQWDLVPRQFISNLKSLEQHIDEWKKDLEGKGDTLKQVRQQSRKVSRICTECRFTYPCDLDAQKFRKWLLMNVNEGKFGVTTSNHYLTTANTFCNWLARNGVLADSPFRFLEGRKNTGNPNGCRRALTHEEFERLFKATTGNKKHHGMDGPQRAILYHLAIRTGLRWSELRSLLVSNLHLKGYHPYIYLEPANTKNRKQAKQPLPNDTAEMLANYCKGKNTNERVFDMWKEKGAECLRRDLASAEIPFKDDLGRKVDFHALRHSFITHLADSGVHPAVAQRLARHCSITLTMDRYTHTGMDQLYDAINLLQSKANGYGDRSSYPVKFEENYQGKAV